MAIELPPDPSGGSSGRAARETSASRPMTPFRRARIWLAERLSIRQRLTLWYATLLIALLTLLSAVTFTIAENQIQTNLNSDIRVRAIAIAGALQHEQYSSDGGSSVLPSGTPSSAPTSTVVVPTATPSATAQPTPKPNTTASANATATAGATANETPTVVPSPATTPDPATNAAIQKQLTLTVPDVLGRLDLGFEVLDSGGRLKYLAPSLNGRSLPINYAVVNDALRGVSGSYSARVDGALLAIYVQPIEITPRNTGRSPGASATPTPTPSGGPVASAADQIAGVVLVAKSEEDVNNALSTLGRILLIGDLVAIFCALLGGWLIAESSLRPITTITRAASAIARDASAAGLGTRVRYRGAKDEVGELVSTFNEMLASLEQVADAQRRFVSDASHELRAPLTTIRGNLELLRQAPRLSSEERAEIIDDAYVEAERMATLVSDLLMLARVDAASASRGARATLLDEQLSGRREVVEMDQLAMELYRSGQSHLRALRKHINLSVTEIAPVSIMADPGQARQLGMILLDNAIKYTPRDGSITIAVGQLGPFATLTVSDTGIGIQESDLPHIFERFYRADRARERDEHGSGLGLAIARWITEAHHGEIKVESVPGRGTTFTVLLPAAKRVGDQTSPKIATGRRKRVRKNTLSLDPIKPLARLAQSVSRPVRVGPPRAGRANGANGAGARGAAKGGASSEMRSSSPTSAVSPNTRSSRRSSAPPRRE
ncbi:MAG TPA: HAMP domain-containing sensor histidine kinase [Ktedonobacterales bacterium]|nr:HAMP domain-containing sensor histidine kinase [Ktedonobacterales bacterium]